MAAQTTGPICPDKADRRPGRHRVCHGQFRNIYAVNPDGTLRWVVSPAGGVSGCLGMTNRGNLVVRDGAGVQAPSPVDGSTVWTFPIQTPLVAGPSVGPDGNIYAADDSRWSQPVIGAFILSPGGQLIWSGGKYYRRGGESVGQDIKFGSVNPYFSSDYSSTGDPRGSWGALTRFTWAAGSTGAWTLPRRHARARRTAP